MGELRRGGGEGRGERGGGEDDRNCQQDRNVNLPHTPPLLPCPFSFSLYLKDRCAELGHTRSISTKNTNITSGNQLGYGEPTIKLSTSITNFRAPIHYVILIDYAKTTTSTVATPSAITRNRTRNRHSQAFDKVTTDSLNKEGTTIKYSN